MQRPIFGEVASSTVYKEGEESVELRSYMLCVTAVHTAHEIIMIFMFGGHPNS